MQSLVAFLYGITLEVCTVLPRSKRLFPVLFAFPLSAYTITSVVCKPGGKGFLLKGCKNKSILKDSVLSDGLAGFVINLPYFYCIL